MPSPAMDEEYVRLALAIDLHAPGYVDAYFGPPAWKEQAKADGPRPLPELARRASDLASAVAGDGTLDSQRKDYLSRHIVSMRARLRLLQGERMALADEAELLYDVRPAWVDESVLDEGLRQLDSLLPPGRTLLERIADYNHKLEISFEKARALFPLIVQHLREISRQRFPLPEKESIEISFVQNKPWLAYNSYLGGGRSRIDINTDTPFLVERLVGFMAHEAYPGHHTELAIKDSRLVQQAGHLEHTVALINSPASVVAEGIASCARSAVLSDEALVDWQAREIFPSAGLHALDARRDFMIREAYGNLDGVMGNAAFLLHDKGAPVPEVIAYLQRYGLRSEADARREINFVNDPADRSYIFTYSEGKRLLEALFALKKDVTHWFTRLLTEAVTPTQIRQWMLE